jgi:protein TonB
MIDPVSKELERREHLDVPWRWAILAAIGLHLAVAGTFLLAPSKRPRALSLPSVRVRITAMPVPAPAPARASAPVAPTRPPAPLPSPKAAARKAVEPPPKHAVPAKKPAKEVAPAPAEEPPPAQPSGPGGTGTPAASAGGIALGVGGTGGEDSFPFSYYLNRVLALIESNWFRPPATEASRCRVRCVIDRSGRLVEAGLEQESPTPAFDRAALRAVYAAAPFPPLPQGFGGNTLTLHLEFGP